MSTGPGMTWRTTHGDTVEVFNRPLRLRKQWHWHIRAINGEVVEQGEGYARRIDAVTAAERHHPPVEGGDNRG